VNELGKTIQKIRKDFNLTVLLVEHHMGLVMSISDHIVALNFGRRIAEGTPEQVAQNPASHTGKYLARLLSSARTSVN